VAGEQLSVEAGATLLQVADRAGADVPRLCAHPGLSTHGRCGLCAVEVEGRGVVRACETPAEADLIVHTASEAAHAARTEALNRLLAIHPHACLTCDLREGCSRSQCSYGTPATERCCEKFGACELQKVAYFIGIPTDAPSYVPRLLPRADEGPYSRNLELCIGCLRCVDACRDIGQVAAVGERALGGLVLPAPARGETMKGAGCVYCGACVQVCPTGALLPNRDEKARRWLERARQKLGLERIPEPPRSVLCLNRAMVAQVPAVEGVYQLYDASGAVRKIKGVMDLRSALQEELEAGKAVTFTYDEDPMYTSRESQLIQQYLAEHGSMPEGDDLDELF
jgi:predicted molibdopterin-dependent oxidoreductase YjgC